MPSLVWVFLISTSSLVLYTDGSLNIMLLDHRGGNDGTRQVGLRRLRVLLSKLVS